MDKKEFRIKEIKHETFKSFIGLMFRIEVSFYNINGLDMDIIIRYVSSNLIEENKNYSLSEIYDLI
jgi:hypothetical protein